MKLKAKVVFSILFPILVMCIIPLLVFNLFHQVSGLGFIFVSFFAVNPLLSIFLGSLAGSDVRHMWWVTIAIPLFFPLLFGIAIHDFVLDLYIYSLFYLILSVASMAITWFVIKKVKKRNSMNR